MVMEEYLEHHGVKGQKWGIRHDRKKYTSAYKTRLNICNKYAPEIRRANKRFNDETKKAHVDYNAGKISNKKRSQKIGSAATKLIKSTNKVNSKIDKEYYKQVSRKKSIAEGIVSAGLGATLVAGSTYMMTKAINRRSIGHGIAAGALASIGGMSIGSGSGLLIVEKGRHKKKNSH